MLQSVIFDYRSYCICSLGNHERDLLFAKREDNEKTEAVYMDSFLQKSAMREKRKWGGGSSDNSRRKHDGRRFYFNIVRM